MSKKIIVWIFISSIFSSIAAAAELSDYPDFFIDGDEMDAIIVVGDKAPASHVLAQADILLSLGTLVADARGKTRLASEVDSLDQNIISIGNACVNNVSAEILGNPQNCKADKAEILMLEEDGNVHIILNANSEDAIRSLAYQLVNYDSADLRDAVEYIELPENDEEESDDQDIEERETEVAENLNAGSFEDSSADEEEAAKEEDSMENGQANGPQPILKEEDNLIKKLISWFLSLFGQK